MVAVTSRTRATISASGSGAANASAILEYIAVAGTGAQITIPGGTFEVGALGNLADGTHLHFEGTVLIVPGWGASLSAAADITLATALGSIKITGNATFVGYRRVFAFDSVAASATIEAENLTFKNCGRTYNYTNSADRIDFNAAFGCRVTNANTIKRLRLQNIRCEADSHGQVCDFGVVWRSGFDEALIDGATTDGLGRMLVMLGDNATWINCKNISVKNLVARDIYPRRGTTTETECHAWLTYGWRTIIDGAQIDTVYDTSTGAHDTEAGYCKGLVGTINNVHIKNGSTGDAYLSIKGATPTAAELVDLGSIGVGTTSYAAYWQVDNISLEATPGFVATYGAQSGLYCNGTRVNVGSVQTIGEFDRHIELTGAVSISGPVRLNGSGTYGIVCIATGTTGTQDNGAVRLSDIVAEGSFASAGIEYRIQGANANVTVGSVEISDCTVVNSNASVGGQFSLRVEKSSNQNTLSLVRLSDCVAIDTGGSGAGLLVWTDGGTGSNEGIVTAAEVTNFTSKGGAYHARVTGTAGKVVLMEVTGGASSSLATAMMSNPDKPTTMRLNGVQGDYPTERKGSATLSAFTADGATFYSTVTTTFSSARQSNLYPTAAQNIDVIMTGSIGAATEWWVSNVGSNAFRVYFDADPGISVTLGWRAGNLYAA